MAKRKARPSVRKAKSTRKSTPRRRSAGRPKAGRSAKARRRAPSARAKSARSTRRVRRRTPKTARSARAALVAQAARSAPRLNRTRRTLEETVPTPPSSLNLDRRGSAARTGRAELAGNLQKLASLTPAITGGDVDGDVENAYFSGDEAPGGDNPTPDQDIVDDIGKAIGLQYQDGEELKAADKVIERDKHRWELDPASAEDYKERK